MTSVFPVEPTVKVLYSVADERRRQTDKWGKQSHVDDKWNRILGEEVGEVAKALNDHEGYLALRAELIQVAAVAVAWVEDLDEKMEVAGL